ncbi:MAG: CoA pyrophosphatase [Chitinophagaceae bacterium]
MDLTIDTLRQRLCNPLPGWAAQQRMTGNFRPHTDVIPPNARESAVLQILFPKDNELQLLFIRRTEDGRPHGGQISFPGGQWETTDANFQETALRETEEEIGVSRNHLDVLGALTPLYIPVSLFQVHPFVACCAIRPDFTRSEAEVADILEVPLSFLFHKDNKIITEVSRASQPDWRMEVPAYKLPDETIVWGATAMMLAELEAVLEGEEFLR